MVGGVGVLSAAVDSSTRGSMGASDLIVADRTSPSSCRLPSANKTNAGLCATNNNTLVLTTLIYKIYEGHEHREETHWGAYVLPSATTGLVLHQGRALGVKVEGA